MNHFSEQDWTAYVKDELSEAQREEMERHLYACDGCLERFMFSVEAVEASGGQLPVLIEGNTFAQEVMDKIRPTPSRFWDNVLLQYAMAASITFILFFSGVFHDLLDGSSQLARWTAEKDGFSLADTLMNKAVSMIDFLNQSRE